MVWCVTNNLKCECLDFIFMMTTATTIVSKAKHWNNIELSLINISNFLMSSLSWCHVYI